MAVSPTSCGLGSRATTLTIAAPTPPVTICAATHIGPRGSGVLRLTTEPSAHAMGDRAAANAPAPPARSSVPAFSTTTPTRPSAIASHSFPETRSPVAREKSVAQSGMVATTIEASPVETERSATFTSPSLLTTKNSTPVIAAAPHSRGVGARSPRARRYASQSEPPRRNRSAASMYGAERVEGDPDREVASTPRRRRPS